MRSTQEYQKEDFNTPAPYEAILSIENPFEQEVAVNQMAEYAKNGAGRRRIQTHATQIH